MTNNKKPANEGRAILQICSGVSFHAMNENMKHPKIISLLLILLLLCVGAGVFYLYKTQALQTKTSTDKQGQILEQLKKQAESPNSDPVDKKIAFLDMADIYAGPDSSFFDPKKARHYYLKSYTCGEFEYFYQADQCENHFSNIPDGLVQNDIHMAVLQELRTYCRSSDDELFQIAARFETAENSPFQDKQIALELYKNLDFRLLDQKQNPLQQAVRDKIEKLSD